VNLGLEDMGFLIGGGSRGLGRAVASSSSRRGRASSSHAIRSGVERTAEELGELAYPYPADLSDPDAAEELAAAAAVNLGRLDGVLVNAGGRRRATPSRSRTRTGPRRSG